MSTSVTEMKATNRLLGMAVSAAVGLSLLWLGPGSAFAAHPCHSIQVAGGSTTAKVGTVRVSCTLGRDVAAEVYAEIEERGSESGTPRIDVGGFACEAVLAETELSCRKGRRWIFASTQATDHPRQWKPPPPPPRRCGGIARAEGFEILAATPRTTCHFARAAAKKVRHVAYHSGHGIPKRFEVKVLGRPLACRNTYVGPIEKIICQGRQRKMVMEYTSP